MGKCRKRRKFVRIVSSMIGFLTADEKPDELRVRGHRKNEGSLERVMRFVALERFSPALQTKYDEVVTG